MLVYLDKCMFARMYALCMQNFPTIYLLSLLCLNDCIFFFEIESHNTLLLVLDQVSSADNYTVPTLNSRVQKEFGITGQNNIATS